MSTIASPREPHPRRMPSSSQTPTSSSRPSLETSRSITGSPNPNSYTGAPLASSSSPSTASTAAATATATTTRRNRAALREYYNLRNTTNNAHNSNNGNHSSSGTTPVLEVTDPLGDHQILHYSEVPPSEMDRPGFDAAAFVGRALETDGLEALLRTYARVLGEIRALDAEKKGLVYDNYSRLITATETIRKMRANMDPLNPMASTLDPAIAQIYSQALSVREAMRQAIPPPPPPPPEDSPEEAQDATTTTAAARRKRTRQLAAQALAAPDRIRRLVREGRADEARREWELPRRLLDTWLQRGLGGKDDVAACIEDGEAALRGEDGPGRRREG